MGRLMGVAAILAAAALTVGAVEAPPSQATSSETVLAQGLALLDQSEFERAWPLLEEAIARPDLPAGLRLTAVRAVVSASIRLGGAARVPDKDAHYVRALKYSRVWAGLDQTARGPHDWAALSLWKLGDYDGAKSEYDELYRRWPTDRHWSAINMSAIDRERGRYADALADLDRLMVDSGPRQGMPYHYHRAATLMLLARDAEAVREIDDGLVAQPGYGWAYVRRACANARLRRYDQALADQRFALEMLRALPAPAGREDYKATKIREVETVLEGFVATKAGGRLPTEGPADCMSVSVVEDRMRTLSPLLTVTAAGARAP